MKGILSTLAITAMVGLQSNAALADDVVCPDAAARSNYYVVPRQVTGYTPDEVTAAFSQTQSESQKAIVIKDRQAIEAYIKNLPGFTTLSSAELQARAQNLQSQGLNFNKITSMPQAEAAASANANPATPAANTTATEETTIEGQVIDGLADFIQQRTKAELEDWATGYILDSLCTSSSPAKKGFFQETCRIQINRNAHAVDVANTTTKLVMALRDDFQNLPACAIYQDRKNSIGYRLSSIYKQNANGADIDNLLFGLAQSGNLNVDNICTDSDYQTKNAKSYCSVVVPVIAYVAMVQVQDRLKNTDPEKPLPSASQVALVQDYAYAIGKLADKNKLPSLHAQAYNWVSELNSDDLSNTASALRDLISHHGEIATRMRSLGDSSGKDGKDSHKDAAADKPSPRDQVVANLSAIQDDFNSQFTAVLHLGFMAKDDESLISGSMELFTALQGANASFQAHEYSTALADLDPILDCFNTTTGTIPQPSWCPFKFQDGDTAVVLIGNARKVAGGAAVLAEAKSSDDFAASLDQIASPVGSWRREQETWTFGISAFGGVRYAQETYAVPGFGNLHENNLAIFAPIGVHATFAWHSSWGIFLSLLDVGNIIEQPRDITFAKGKITGSVDSKLGKVFTPGIYLTYAPPVNIPLTVGFGLSSGPSDYRQVNFNNGTTATVSRGNVVGFFVAVDIPILPFH